MSWVLIGSPPSVDSDLHKRVGFDLLFMPRMDPLEILKAKSVVMISIIRNVVSPVGSLDLCFSCCAMWKGTP